MTGGETVDRFCLLGESWAARYHCARAWRLRQSSSGAQASQELPAIDIHHTFPSDLGDYFRL